MKKGFWRKLLFVAALCVFLFSGIMVTKHSLDMREGAQQAEAVASRVLSYTFRAEQSPVPQTGNPEEETVTETAPIEVDFDSLLAMNGDVVGWLYCPDSPINYPVVQSEDNQYYLYRLLNGSKNASGSIFVDCRNAPGFADWNTLIYGHNMNNGTMFGSLSEYELQSYFEAHPKIYLLTPEQDYVINVLAGFVVSADSELYSRLNPLDEEKDALVRSWLSSSDFDAGFYPGEHDKLVTLSTCSYAYNNARYVLIGVLNKI